MSLTPEDSVQLCTAQHKKCDYVSDSRSSVQLCTAQHKYLPYFQYFLPSIIAVSRCVYVIHHISGHMLEPTNDASGYVHGSVLCQRNSNHLTSERCATHFVGYLYFLIRCG